MDYSYNNTAASYIGVPYYDINWYDIEGNPFGRASVFNLIVFENANNIIDTKGAMAVGGNFTSPRGLSLAFGDNAKLDETDLNPYNVRFLVGGNVSTAGPLVVVGHVVAGGNLRVAGGSTYLIGKNNEPNQEQQLMELYQANGGSPYWRIADRRNHYAIPNYDIPRYIPASRINADVTGFFTNARRSIELFKQCIDELPVNGTVVDHFHEWILRGSDPVQNVFLIDVRPNGLLNKEIRAEVPSGSLIVVKLRTGNVARMQYGLWGRKQDAGRTLFVFEDASEIRMEVPADIWGSILAPQALFRAHSTGGQVSGNVAVRSFEISPTSGFEFHMAPFIGGIQCFTPLPEVTPFPMPEVTPIQECPPCPEQAPCPMCPEQAPCPVPPPCPEQAPCPVPPPCPEQAPCPVPPPCPEQAPCPVCPEQAPCPVPPPCPVCPEQAPCPVPPPCPVCPEQSPCPSCPECPEQQPCPACPEAETRIIPIPVPVLLPCPECPPCEEAVPCPKVLVTPGVILGCIWGCYCCDCHDWEVKLYKICDDTESALYCEKISCCGCFEFKVNYEDFYLLKICPAGKDKKRHDCKPILSLKNVGVASLMLEYN